MFTSIIRNEINFAYLTVIGLLLNERHAQKPTTTNITAISSIIF